MRTYRCDICRKDITKKAGGMVYIKLYPPNSIYPEDVWMDMCKKCYKQFIKDLHKMIEGERDKYDV